MKEVAFLTYVLSVRKQDNSKSYERIFMTLSMNACHQNISFKINFEGYICRARTSAIAVFSLQL